MSELSREHEEFRQSLREFAEAEIAPHAAQWDRDHFPVDVVQTMGQFRHFGLTSPEQYGGAGEDGDFSSLCVAIEELGRVGQSMGITLEAAVGGINPILTFSTGARKQARLPDLISGERLVGFGLTEPGAGSDAGATKSKADLEGGEWLVSGAKQYTTNSDPEITNVGRAEISTILVPAGTGGFTAEKAYDKLGWAASDTYPLTFQDCRVPEASLLGERGAATRSSGPTTAGSRSPRWRSAASRSVWASPWSMAVTGRPSAYRSAASRGVAFQIADLAVMQNASRRSPTESPP